MLSKDYPDRGKVGPTPAMTRRADESFLNYIKDLRSVLMMAPAKDVHPKANAVIEAEGIQIKSTHESAEAVRDVVRRKLPEAGVWARVYRSTQQAFWGRICESYGLREGAFLDMLEKSDQSGPGSVEWDPDYVYPDYAKVDIHLQPGGYVGHPLAGLRYDYGSQVFSGKVGENDYLHQAMAKRVPTPMDGRVERIMDIACSVGKLTCALKERFPDAEVWGTDISAPMVRYANYRAIEQERAVHFLQKAGEDLDELPANQFDLVSVHILFHETPTPVTDRIIANVYRMLRPGGTFWISDFPTLGNDPDGLHYTNLLGAIDSADNCEPYAPEFVRSNIEDKLRKIGFTLRFEDPADINAHGRVCDKPL